MFDLIGFVKEQALEKYAGDQAAADAFVDGFMKQAADFGGFNSFSELARGEAIKNSTKIGFGLLAGLAGAGIVAGINHAGASSTNYKLRARFEASLAQVMATNRVVKGASPEKAKAYAETIFRFAPSVASDPNLLSSILANAVLGEGIDQMTIKSLVDLEGRHSENKSYNSPIPSFKV